jgi:hypothetical protein
VKKAWVYYDVYDGRWKCHVLNRETGDEYTYSCPTREAAEWRAHYETH